MVHIFKSAIWWKYLYFADTLNIWVFLSYLVMCQICIWFVYIEIIELWNNYLCVFLIIREIAKMRSLVWNDKSLNKNKHGVFLSFAQSLKIMNLEQNNLFKWTLWSPWWFWGTWGMVPLHSFVCLFFSLSLSLSLSGQVFCDDNKSTLLLNLNCCFLHC